MRWNFSNSKQTDTIDCRKKGKPDDYNRSRKKYHTLIDYATAIRFINYLL